LRSDYEQKAEGGTPTQTEAMAKNSNKKSEIQTQSKVKNKREDKG
jgi:hypothetical protein